MPVLFLDLNADDLSTTRQSNTLNASFESGSYLDGMNEDFELPASAGLNSILPKEHGGQFFMLPIVRLLDTDDDVGAVASWDSSVHDNSYLNRVTETNERVYLILRATVRLSHPSSLDLVLRKRVAVNVYKKQSLATFLMKKIGRGDVVTQSGVMYEIVSNVPKASEDLEGKIDCLDFKSNEWINLVCYVW